MSTPDDVSRTSFRTQIGSVFKHPEKRDLYISLADRWMPSPGADVSNFEREFERAFAPDGSHTTIDLPEVATSVADQVWLPIRFDADTPTVAWCDEWRVEDFDWRCTWAINGRRVLGGRAVRGRAAPGGTGYERA